jgi:quinol monooxygenase YgiN
MRQCWRVCAPLTSCGFDALPAPRAAGQNGARGRASIRRLALPSRQSDRREGIMILEIAQVDVKPGEEAAFEAAVAEATKVFRRAAGCLGLELQRSIEKPSRYRVMIRWRTLENHTVDFRGSPLFQEWRALVGPHFAAPPEVEHCRTAMAAVNF